MVEQLFVVKNLLNLWLFVSQADLDGAARMLIRICLCCVLSQTKFHQKESLDDAVQNDVGE